MLDIKFIRDNIELVKSAVKNKGEKVDIDEFVRLDQKRRELVRRSDELKHRRNVVSDEIGRLKKKGKQPSTPAPDAAGAQAELINEMKQVSRQIKELDDEVKIIDDRIHQILIWVPNIPHPSVPVGPDSNYNQEIRRWGTIVQPDFEPRTHLEIGKKLGMLDFEKGSKVAGSNFVTFKGWGARLERALINFMLDVHIEKHGYTEVSPPFVVKRDSMFSTGQLPKLEEDMYLVEEDDLFLIPTAEVPLTNLHREEILNFEDLPLYYVSYTPCFRREAGSYGRETKGLVRIHQFDKVELVKFVKPEDSYQELETLLANAEEILQLLNLPYRVMCLSTGDLSFAAAKCYDIEVWAQGLQRYLEVSSCSNFEDFQARRAEIRFRRTSGAKLEYVHTLNGSGLALPRTVIAIIENYQTDEGTVVVPEALRPYMKVDIIK